MPNIHILSLLTLLYTYRRPMRGFDDIFKTESGLSIGLPRVAVMLTPF